ncbi:MAG: hypothetical protein ACOC0E_03585 [Spirochaetota bacterium]
MSADRHPGDEAARLIVQADHEPEATLRPTGEKTRGAIELFLSLSSLLPPLDDEENAVHDSLRDSSVTPATDRPAASGVRAAAGTDVSDENEPRPRRGELFARPRKLWPKRVPPVPVLIVATAVVTLLAATLVIPGRSFEPEAAIYLDGTGAAADARGVVLADEDTVLVYLSGVSDLEQGYRYVAWGVDNAGARRLGTLSMVGSGRARLRLDARAAGTAPEGPDRRGSPLLPARVEVTIESSTSAGEPEGPVVAAGARR